jgi:hypothetical protein
MKAYGVSRSDVKTCEYGCCGTRKNPRLCGVRANTKPLVKRAKARARRASKALIVES